MYLWNYLQETRLPVLVYGMGNGADKIFSLCESHGIPVSGVFVSDDHCSSKLFHNLPLQTWSDVRQGYASGIILLAFGVYQQEVLDRIAEMARQFEVYAPDLPLTGGPLITPDYLAAHSGELARLRALLQDEQSQRCLNGILENKLSGAIPPMQAVETAREEDLLLLQPGLEEHYLDLGAYDGDTIDEFLSLTGGRYGSITALEADAHNYRKLCKHVEGMERVTCLPRAAWNEACSLTFSGKGGRNVAVLPRVPGLYKHLHAVDAIPVDSLQQDFTWIKFDIEGAEAEALEGMAGTLRRCHPKLMVSVYHKTDDFLRLPLLIDRLCPGYRMYLRKNPCLPAWELQLYCIFPAEALPC